MIRSVLGEIGPQLDVVLHVCWCKCYLTLLNNSRSHYRYFHYFPLPIGQLSGILQYELIVYYYYDIL